jgi:hypothetical protein
MSSAINITPSVQAPAGPAKKARAARKRTAATGMFGLLSDWKIDT